VSDRVRNVLFLCTGNSARSVLAESALNRLGAGRFRGYSAGSHPTGRVHPMTLRCLEARGHPTAGLRSKGFEAFDAPGAPELDLVITVCDGARGEACPVWPGQPVRAHWGLPDPAAFEGSESETRAVFDRAYEILAYRVALLVDLPIDDLDSEALARELARIGEALPLESPSPRGG